jgi:hypothetical protein
VRLRPRSVRGLGIRLDGREVPAEFSEASKIYRILKSTADKSQPTLHPFTVIEHALGKGLPLPGPLLDGGTRTLQPGTQACRPGNG